MNSGALNRGQEYSGQEHKPAASLGHNVRSINMSIGLLPPACEPPGNLPIGHCFAPLDRLQLATVGCPECRDARRIAWNGKIARRCNAAAQK